jgi:CzcA family heavy metal efflux pump
MIRWVVGSSLRSRGLVLVLAAALLFFGFTQLRNVPVDVLPEFSPPMVEVQTEALGLSAAEVEELITVPLEQDLLNGVAWLDTIRSESIPGLSRVELIFEPGTDLLRARQVVTERLTQSAGLPQVAKPPAMLQPLSSTSRVMMVGLSSKEVSAIQMSVLARWTIRPRLLGVPGVANVAIWGQRERQLQVQADPKRLNDAGVSLNQLVETTGNALWVSPLTFLEASTPGTGGFIDTPNQRLGIRHVLPIVNPDDLAQVIVDGAKPQGNGQPLRVGDIAKVVEDHQPLIGDAVHGEDPGLLLVIEKFPGANTLEVTKGVEEALAAMAPGLSGIEVDANLFRPATFIETAVDNLTTALLLGALLLLLVFGLFLFEWRSALISVAAVVLSLLAALAVLYLRDATVNAVVLAGLVAALGVIVDDAIVDVDNIARRLRQHRQEGGDRPAAKVIFDAAVEVRSPIAYATAIMVVAVAPAFFLEGLSGAFLPPLVVSYLLAVAASMLVALFVTPALSLLLLSRAPLERREPPLARLLQRGYERALAPVVHTPGRALAAGAAGLVVVLLGVAMVPLLSQDLAPTFKDTDLLVRLEGAPGTSHPEMTRVTAQASRELGGIPGVRDVGAHVGRAVSSSDQIVSVNSSELWVSVDPSADYDKTVANIQQVVGGYPGLDGEVLTYPKKRIDAVLSGADDRLTVRVYGQDLEVLRSKAEEVRQAIAGVDGTADQQVQRLVEEPTLEIEVDLAKAQQVGIKPGDVRRAAATMLSGIQVGNLFEEQKVFDVVVWGAPAVRDSLTSIRELMVDVPGGGQVQLGEVANVRVKPALSVIRHEDVSRSIDVTASVSGRSLGSVVSDVEAALGNVQFPLEYHAEVLGNAGDEQAAQRRTLAIAAIAALLVFLLLQVAFGSWRLATVAFLTLPMALVGGLLAVLATGSVLSLGALVGFVLVLGIAVRNLVMLVSHFQHLEREEGETFGPGLVMRGARDRLSPILLTAVATAAVLVPLLVLGNVPGQEILQPMAVAVLGGLVTATLLNLFVAPALYLRFGSDAERRLNEAQ